MYKMKKNITDEEQSMVVELIQLYRTTIVSLLQYYKMIQWIKIQSKLTYTIYNCFMVTLVHWPSI